MMTAPSSDTPRATILNLKLFMFFVYGTVSVLATFLPVYLQHLGFGKSGIGMLIAAGPLMSVIANPFWGYWSDRTQNIRRILLIILTANFLIILAVFQLEQYAWVYGVMMVFYLFQTPLFSQTSSLILSAIEGTSTQFGSYRVWGSMGWAFLAVGAAPVIGYVTIDRLWIVYCILMIVTLILCLGLPKGGTQSQSRASSGLKDILSNKVFLIFLLITVVVATPHGLNGMFVSIYIIELGGATWLIGLAAFLMAIFEVPIFLLMDRYLKKSIPTMLTTLAVVSGLYTIRWFLMSYVTEPWQVIVLQGTHAITFGIYYYVGTNLTSMFVSASHRATGQSTYTLAWNGISGIIAGFLGSQFLQLFGYQSTYQVGMVMTFIGMICFLLMRMKIKE